MNKEFASLIDVAVATNDQVFLATAISQEDFDAYWEALPHQDERDMFTYAVNAAWAYMYGEDPDVESYLDDDEEESCAPCEQIHVEEYIFFKALDSEPVGMYHSTWDEVPSYRDPGAWLLIDPRELPF